MALSIDQVQYILGGPDPRRWSILATGGHYTETPPPHFMCKSRLAGRGRSSQFHFHSVRAMPRLDGVGWYFSAEGDFYPAEAESTDSPIIGSFNPTIAGRVKGQFVAVSELPKLWDIGTYLDNLAESASA